MKLFNSSFSFAAKGKKKSNLPVVDASEPPHLLGCPCKSCGTTTLDTDTLKVIHPKAFDNFANAYLTLMAKPIIRYSDNDLTDAQKKALGTRLIEAQSGAEEEIPENERTPGGPTTRKKLVYQQTEAHPVMQRHAGIVKNETGQWTYDPHQARGRYLTKLSKIFATPWIAHVDRKKKNDPFYSRQVLGVYAQNPSRDMGGGLTLNSYRDEDGTVKEHDFYKKLLRANGIARIEHSLGMKEGLDDIKSSQDIDAAVNGKSSLINGESGESPLGLSESLNKFLKTALETGSPDHPDPRYTRRIQEASNGQWVFDPTMEGHVRSYDDPFSCMIDIKPIREIARGHITGEEDSADPRLSGLVQQHLLPDAENISGKMRFFPPAHNMRTHFSRVRQSISNFSKIKKQLAFNGETKRIQKNENQGWVLGIQTNPIEEALQSTKPLSENQKVDALDQLIKRIKETKKPEEPENPEGQQYSF